MPRPIAPHLALAFALVLASGVPSSVPSAWALAPDSDSGFRAHVDNLQTEGELGYEEALLLRFQRAFDPDDLPEEAESLEPWPDKSLTLLIHEYGSVRTGLSQALVETVDDYLADGLRAESHSYGTPHFRLAYDTDGLHAVPPEDLDASGVPDFVERIGAWAEQSRNAFLDVGFTAPIPSDGAVEISFRQMSAYGYTQLVAGIPRIVLHRNFSGFPANRDPEGNDRGAAKVTVAHELKHASQYASSGWTEGGWLEADATWAEDFVFDGTDDYIRYLAVNSPVSSPASWMPVSYEDCLWQQCLEQSFGVDVLVDFFDRRAAQPGEPVMESFSRVLDASGNSLDQAMETLGVWSYFSGANAVDRPAGFADADRFPTPPLRSVLAQAGDTVTDTMAPLANHHVLVARADRAGVPEISFVGDRHSSFALNALVTGLDGSRVVHALPMVSPTSSAAALDTTWEETASIVLIATRLGVAGEAQYSLTFNDENSVGIPELESGAMLSLDANYPNPFRTTTTISFSLGVPSSVRLAVFDVSGRLVRRLHDGRALAAGRHDVTWDGIDEAGRASAPGVYYYRLEAPQGAASRRMLLLR
jgi:hypothetical protein